MDDLKKLTEKHLGTKLEHGEFEKVLPEGERKLRRIIKMEGEARKPEYLALILAELISMRYGKMGWINTI